MTKTKIKVNLVGEDGNAFAIIGRCTQAMRRGGCSEDEVIKFQDEATSGDYHKLLSTCMKWFEV